MQDVINFNLLKEYDSALKDVLGVWQKEKTYSVDEVIQYKGNYLKCTTAGTSGTTTLNFTGIDIGDTITDGTVVWEMIEPPSGSGNGLNDWVANTQYKIDSIVVNNGQIYKALVEFTSGSTFENIEILEDYELQTEDTPIPWAESTEINTNDIVSYDGKYYKALIYFTCGSTFTKNVLEEYVPKSLTDEDIENVIDAYEPVFSEATGVVYSTEEQRIGTWIDGKPLYQKTLSLEHINVQPMSSSLASSVIDTTFLTSIQKDRIVKIDYICRIIGTGEYAGVIGYESYEDLEFQFNNEITLRHRWGSTPQLCDVYITVEYTKTTD